MLFDYVLWVSNALWNRRRNKLGRRRHRMTAMPAITFVVQARNIIEGKESSEAAQLDGARICECYDFEFVQFVLFNMPFLSFFAVGSAVIFHFYFVFVFISFHRRQRFTLFLFLIFVFYCCCSFFFNRNWLVSYCVSDNHSKITRTYNHLHRHFQLFRLLSLHTHTVITLIHINARRSIIALTLHVS